jgi:hypothetical protein
MPASPRLPARSFLALALLALVSVLPSAPAARAAADPVATISRHTSSWQAAPHGSWWWRATLSAQSRVQSVEITLKGKTQRVTVASSADGRRFTAAATVKIAAGKAQRVSLGGRSARYVRLAVTSRSAPATRVSKVRVQLATTAARKVSAKTPAVGAPTAAAPSSTATPSSTTTATAPVPATSTSTSSPPPARAYEPTGPAPAPKATSGAFAGVLSDPIDAKYLTGMPFGTRSNWIQPWRAYLETPPAKSLKNAIGINFNVNAGDAAPTARLLAANGFHEARLEINWGEFRYDRPDQLVNAADWATKLVALRDAGLRPLILLTSFDGRPAPYRDVALTITQPITAGARTVQLDAASAAAVVPGRTGLNGSVGAQVLITSVNGSGLATLSQPIPVSLPAGTYPGMTVRYAPFSPLTNADGSTNAEGMDTMNGWLDYVNATTHFVAAVMGSTNFDVEIFNEATSGSAFFNINNYYSPARYPSALDDPVLLKRTIDWIKDPAHGLPGVRVGSGFSNQRPWDSGATAPAGLDALDKHPYPQMFAGASSQPANRPLDALGNTSGWLVGGRWYDAFSPTEPVFFPEFWLTGIFTETTIRDIAPITTTMSDGTPHGRATAPAGAAAPQVWMTEMGLETGWATRNLGATITAADAEHLRAKAALRTLTSFVNKGVTQVDLYAAGTTDWGLVGNAFWSQLHATGTYPGDDTGGETTSGVHRLVSALGDQTITVRRSLSLGPVGDYSGARQFSGDGTAAHPALSDRDALAFLPFQASDHRFVVPVYVMTHNMAKVYRPDAPTSDPTRYDLPAERYQLVIGGTNAAAAKVSATDPLTGRSVPVDVVDRTSSGWLVVEMPVTDSPRLLTIDDAS